MCRDIAEPEYIAEIFSVGNLCCSSLILLPVRYYAREIYRYIFQLPSKYLLLFIRDSILVLIKFSSQIIYPEFQDSIVAITTETKRPSLHEHGSLLGDCSPTNARESILTRQRCKFNAMKLNLYQLQLTLLTYRKLYKDVLI